MRCLPLPDSPVLTSRVAVSIQVLDINEFPPELATFHETFVCENAKAGQVRSRVPTPCCARAATASDQAARQPLIGGLFICPEGRLLLQRKNKLKEKKKTVSDGGRSERVIKRNTPCPLRKGYDRFTQVDQEEKTSGNQNQSVSQ